MTRSFSRRAVLGTTVLASAGLFAGVGARAQAPDKLVRLVVPFSAGSTTDLLARAIAPVLAARWKQDVIVDNRPGAPGALAVARATPDGSTLMLTSNGHIVLNAVNANLAFHPLNDFTAISQVASQPMILVVPPESPYRSVADLVAAAKSGTLNFASAGASSATGIASLLFNQVAGTSMTHVPYRGLPEMQTSVMRGDSAMALTFFNGGGELIQSGKLRALAVTGDRRMSQLPDVPTFAEAGMPSYRYDAWFGILAPAGLPAGVQAEAAAAVADAIRSPEVAGRFGPLGVVLTSNTPAEFSATMKADAERYGPLVAAAART